MERFMPVGELIAMHRRRRGLSQVQLAGLLGRSESWLSQVERGVRSIDRISVLVELADVLKVEVTELTAGLPPMRELEDHHGVVNAIQLALSGHDGLGPALGPGTGPPPSLPALEDQVRQAWALVHASRYAELGGLLPVLITALEVAAHQPGSEQAAAAFGLLGQAYQVTSATMAKLGETDAAWVAADRSVAAAERAGQPLLAVAGAFRLGHAFLSGGKFEQARRAAGVATAALETRLAASPKELVSLWGALNLVSAIAAAKQNDADAAWASIHKAEAAARRLGQDRDDFGTEFGPTNVALHRVSVAVELGDGGEALRRAGSVNPAGLSPERRARFLVDLARAHGQQRNGGAAVGQLLEAEALAPEEVQRSPLVQEVVRDFLRRERRRTDPHLRALAQRMGVLAERPG